MRAVALLVLGALVGVPLVIAIGRLIRSLLFVVQPLEWSRLVTALVLLVVHRQRRRVDPGAACRASRSARRSKAE